MAFGPRSKALFLTLLAPFDRIFADAEFTDSSSVQFASAPSANITFAAGANYTPPSNEPLSYICATGDESINTRDYFLTTIQAIYEIGKKDLTGTEPYRVWSYSASETLIQLAGGSDPYGPIKRDLALEIFSGLMRVIIRDSSLLNTTCRVDRVNGAGGREMVAGLAVQKRLPNPGIDMTAGNLPDGLANSPISILTNATTPSINDNTLDLRVIPTRWGPKLNQTGFYITLAAMMCEAARGDKEAIIDKIKGRAPGFIVDGVITRVPSPHSAYDLKSRYALDALYVMFVLQVEQRGQEDSVAADIIFNLPLPDGTKIGTLKFVNKRNPASGDSSEVEDVDSITAF